MIDGLKANMQSQRGKMSDAYDRVQKVTSSERKMDHDLRAANALVQQRSLEVQQLGKVSGEQHQQLKSFQAQVQQLRIELIKERSVNRDVSMPVPVDPGPSAIFKPLQWRQQGGKLPEGQGGAFLRPLEQRLSRAEAEVAAARSLCPIANEDKWDTDMLEVGVHGGGGSGGHGSGFEKDVTGAAMSAPPEDKDKGVDIERDYDVYHELAGFVEQGESSDDSGLILFAILMVLVLGAIFVTGK